MDKLLDRFKIARLISKDIANTLTEEERISIDEWLSQSPMNQKEYEEIKEDILKNGYYKPGKDEKKQVRNAWRLFEWRTRPNLIIHRHIWVAASVILIILISGVTKHFYDNGPGVIYHANGNIKVFFADGNICSFENNYCSWINVAKLQQTIQHNNPVTMSEPQKYNTIIVPKGCEWRIQLYDGSRICLNSETMLRYPIAFNDSCREITLLRGEAYFEVAHNKAKPFIVHVANSINILVTGTKFNVSCYEDEDNIITTLIEGSIEVSTSKNKFNIKPHEQFVYYKPNHKTLINDVDDITSKAWTEGLFIFEDEPLSKIMKSLERWYDMEVSYDSETTKNVFLSGEIERNKSFEEVMNMIEEVTNVKVEVKRNKHVKIQKIN
jgi:transmembrane sensor